MSRWQDRRRWLAAFAAALSVCLTLLWLWPQLMAPRVARMQAPIQPILIELHLREALPPVQTAADPAPIHAVRLQPPAQHDVSSARSQPAGRAAHLVQPKATALDQPPASAARPVAQVQAMNNEAGPAAVPANSAEAAETRVGMDGAEDETKLRTAASLALRHDLQRYFRYPPLARRMGWQGEVWLRFDLHDDGAIAAIQVARSSGYDLLDEDAVHTLQQVARLTTAAPGRRLQGLEIPVIYRLTEG